MRSWFVLFLIACSAAVAQAFGRFAFGVVYPAIRDDLSISNTVAALLGATNVGAYLVGTLIVAWSTRYLRLLTTFRTGMILAATGLVIAAVAESPLTLAAGLAMAGVGGAFVWIPAPAIAADAMPERHRNLAVGLMGSGIGFGIVFVSLLAASMRESMGDAAWSGVYQVQALVALAVLVGALVFVRHVQAAPGGRQDESRVAALRRMPGWLPMVSGYAAFGFKYLLVIGFLTTRLEDDSGWSSSDAAYAFTLMGVAMIFGGPLFAAVTNRAGVRFALSLAFFCWPLLVLLVLTGLPVLVLPGVFGLGLLFSAIPSLMTMYVVAHTTLADYGPAFSAATLVFGLAQVVSPPVGGLIADLSGSFTWVFVLSAIVGGLGFLTARRLPQD